MKKIIKKISNNEQVAEDIFLGDSYIKDIEKVGRVRELTNKEFKRQNKTWFKSNMGYIVKVGFISKRESEYWGFETKQKAIAFKRDLLKALKSKGVE